LGKQKTEIIRAKAEILKSPGKGGKAQDNGQRTVASLQLLRNSRVSLMSAAALASLTLNKRRVTSPGKVRIFIKVKLHRALAWLGRLR
jgi:hypothetical protein